MQVYPISNVNSFQGKFQVNPLFEKFKEELNPAQKDVFGKQMKRIEKVQDGRIFMFDKVENPEYSGGAEVGIFEQKFLIDKTIWMPLFCSTRENAVWCFDQLDKMYRKIQICKS